MNKIFTLALAVTMSASLLVGCGNSSGKSNSSVDVTPTKNPEVKIKYLTWSYSDQTKSTDKWIKDMKEKFNITIEMQNVPTDQYAAVFKTHLVSNDIPDLSMVHAITKDLVAEQSKLDADTFIDISSLSSVSKYIPSIIDSVKVNSKLYYVPISTNAMGVLYNKKVFTDNGIIIPTNLAEFNAVCDKLKTAKIVPIASGAKDAWSTQIIPFIGFGQYIDGKDTEIRNKLAAGTMKYADIKGDLTKVLSIQQDWAKKNYIQDNYLGTDINVASQMVGTGKAAMLICGTWQLKTIQDANPTGEVGFFALPLNAAGEKIQLPTNANSGICINSKSKNLEAAKKALDYYLTTEMQKTVMADLNGISTNSQLKPDGAFLKEVATAMSSSNVQPVWWGCNGLYYPPTTSFKIELQIQGLLAGGSTEKFIADFDTANSKALGK